LGEKNYELHDMSGYTYDMDIYLGKDKTCTTTDMIARHITVKQLTEMWKNMDISCTWITSIRCQTYSVICQNRKSVVVGQLDLRERAFHRT
jgi:hypothetical protein